MNLLDESKPSIRYRRTETVAASRSEHYDVKRRKGSTLLYWRLRWPKQKIMLIRLMLLGTIEEPVGK